MKLIYYEAYLERADAEERERYLKSGGEGDSYFDNCGIISKFFPVAHSRRPECAFTDQPREAEGLLRGLPRLDSNQE